MLLIINIYLKVNLKFRISYNKIVKAINTIDIIDFGIASKNI